MVIDNDHNGEILNTLITHWIRKVFKRFFYYFFFCQINIAIDSFFCNWWTYVIYFFSFFLTKPLNNLKTPFKNKILTFLFKCSIFRIASLSIVSLYLLVHVVEYKQHNSCVRMWENKIAISSHCAVSLFKRICFKIATLKQKISLLRT